MKTLAPERFELAVPGQATTTIGDARLGFRNGYVFELINTRENRILKVIVLVLNPRVYTLTEPFAATLTPAEDDTVVSEENGIIVRNIILEGTFGLREKRATGFQGAQGNGSPLSGNAHFRELRQMFRQYSQLKKDPRFSADIRMIFHSLRDDDHFVVVPRSFETPRDSRTTRMHYDYRITLDAIAEADSSTLRPTPDRRSGFEDAVRSINEAFQDGRAFFADVAADLSTFQRKLGNIQTVMLNAARFLNSVGNVVSGAERLISFPLQLAATSMEMLVEAADDLAVRTVGLPDNVWVNGERAIRRIEAAGNRIMMFPDHFGPDAFQNIKETFRGERGATREDVAAATSGVTIGTRTRVVAGTSGREGGLDFGEMTGFGTRVVRITDTIESIATEVGTTPEALILLNDLLPPYLAESRGPGVLAPGDVIVVPVLSADESIPVRTSSEYLTADELLYGTDIAIDMALLERDGVLDLKVNSTTKEDADVVSGLQNVVQGLTIVVHTEIGQTVFLPDIGIRRNVGIKGTLAHVLLASIVLREAILSDPRIEGIRAFRVELIDDMLVQEVTANVTGFKRGVTFVLPFGSAAGGF